MATILPLFSLKQVTDSVRAPGLCMTSWRILRYFLKVRPFPHFELDFVRQAIGLPEHVVVGACTPETWLVSHSTTGSMRFVLWLLSSEVNEIAVLR
jgi:hypothetical protein